MENYRKNVEEAARCLRERLGDPPAVALVLGTGLGGVAESLENPVSIPYRDIPHYPVSTVESHRGRVLCGKWGRKRVLALQGRFHLYEGYTPLEVTFPVRVLAALGVESLVVSNAAGGLNPLFSAGDLMIIADHINFTGRSPLTGPNVDEWGPRFPDMTEPYCRLLQQRALDAALEESMAVQRGVYAGVLGPNLETGAETRMLRALGADAVGMSTVMEVIAAVHGGMKVLGVSVISNVNRPDCYEPVTLEDVIASAEKAGEKLMRLVARVLRGTSEA